MSNRKGQNSLLFITTLGVYLGLVLVGAAPVLGHAATTRNFEISDEIEYKDDLERDPAGGVSSFVDDILSLLNKLESYSNEGKFTWNSKLDYALEDISFDEEGQPAYLGFGNLGTPDGRLFSSSTLSIARKLIAEKVNVSAGENCSKWPQTADVRLRSDSENFQFSISVTTTDKTGAIGLNNELTRFLASISKRSGFAKIQTIAEKTTSEVDDIKVILVTRLPRADLDSLFATDAK